MTVWDELRRVLLRLQDERPGALLGFPSLEAHVESMPPFDLQLAPWAVDTAAEVVRQFGDDVRVTVGSLPYPPGRQRQRRDASGNLPGLLDPHEVAVTLDRPAVVSSGHNLHHELTVHNLTSGEFHLATNGHVTALVVDPQSGEIVGGSPLARTLVLKFFTVPPGERTRIPLFIGTASRLPRLGYAVPPGQWGIRTVLKFGGPPGLPLSPVKPTRRLTPIMPLTVTT